MSINYKASLTCATAAMAVLFLSSASLALAASEPVVVTAPRDVVRSTRVVSFGDLDLLSQRGQRQLDRRIGSAIERVCDIADYHAARSLASLAHYRECSKAAWSDARAQLITAMARAQTGLGTGGNEMASMAIIVSSHAVE